MSGVDFDVCHAERHRKRTLRRVERPEASHAFCPRATRDSARGIARLWLELAITQKDISVPLSSLFSHNTKAVDSTAPRLAFVRDAVRMPLNGGPIGDLGALS